MTVWRRTVILPLFSGGARHAGLFGLICALLLVAGGAGRRFRAGKGA
jgi:hypothetical protein